MDTKVNYVLIGLFISILAVAGMVLFFWLYDRQTGEPYHTYYSYAYEDVTGLGLQSPVRFNGVQVGYISAISLDDQNVQRVRLTLKIEESAPITESTILTLIPMGITGVVYAGLQAKTADAPPLRAKPGEKYPVIPFQPSLLAQLGETLPDLTGSFTQTAISLNQLLNEKNRKAISDALQNIDTITENLAASSEQWEGMLQSLSKTLAHIETASQQLPALMSDLKATTYSVKQTSSQIHSLSQQTSQVLNSTHVMINHLNNQTLPSVQQLLVHLSSVMLNLDQLTQQWQRNPAMLIRGQRELEAGPGERP